MASARTSSRRASAQKRAAGITRLLPRPFALSLTVCALPRALPRAPAQRVLEGAALDYSIREDDLDSDHELDHDLRHQLDLNGDQSGGSDGGGGGGGRRGRGGGSGGEGGVPDQNRLLVPFLACGDLIGSALLAVYWLGCLFE